MAKGSRTDAEATYARAQKRVREASLAMTEAQAETKRINDNTARLRALRLAKEAADAAEAANVKKKPAAPTKKKPTTAAEKKPAASAKKKAPARARPKPAARKGAANDD